MRSRRVAIFILGIAIVGLIAFAVPICHCSLCKVEGSTPTRQACECNSLAATTLHLLHDMLSGAEAKCSSEAGRSAAFRGGLILVPELDVWEGELLRRAVV